VDDAPDAALALVVGKDLVNLALDRDVAAVALDLERLLVLVRRAGRERILRDLGHALERSRERVVEAASERAGGVGSRAERRGQRARPLQVCARVRDEAQRVEGPRRESRNALVDGDDRELAGEEAAQGDVGAWERETSALVQGVRLQLKGTHRCSRQRQ